MHRFSRLAYVAIGLVGTGATAFLQTPPQMSTAVITITVTDMGHASTPVPGVDIKVSDERDRPIDQGLTDGNGAFTTRKAPQGQSVTVQYRLAGYLKDPARITVKTEPGTTRVTGWLISKTDRSPAYLSAAAATIDEMSGRTSSAAARQMSYAMFWDAVAALPEESKSMIAGQLRGGEYLKGVSTYEAAVRRNDDRSRVLGQPAQDDVKITAVRPQHLVYETVLGDEQGNFTFGGVELPDNAKVRLDDMIKTRIKSDPKGAYFVIEGYTDNMGSHELNEKLGLERAEAVKKYLYTTYEIPLSKINVVSYGEDKPVAPNMTREGRAQNRRVVVKVLDVDIESPK